MVTRRSMLAVFGSTALGLVMAGSAYSSSWSKEMRLSFGGPVALPGVTLPAGTYIFERVASDVHVVRVSSADKKTVYLTQFTELVDRPNGLPKTHQLTLGEAGPGMAPPVKVWYPEGLRQGHAFIYDKR